jgi:hypothetical protein
MMEEKKRRMALPINIGADQGDARRDCDRRIPGRFPMDREIRFRMTNKRNELVGTGRTVNMSSKGLLFLTEQRLPAGKRLEMAISWPAQLDQKCALKLIARGKVVRAAAGMAVVSIERYEFRTLGRSGLVV